MNFGPHFKSPTIIKRGQVVSNLHLTFLSKACKKDMEEAAAVRVSNDHKRREKITTQFFSCKIMRKKLCCGFSVHNSQEHLASIVDY